MRISALSYRPLSGMPQLHWRPTESFAFAAGLATLPVAESELLHLSHHLPIAVSASGRRMDVVGVTARTHLRHPLVDEAGRWRRGYVPLALRMLPFGAVHSMTDGQINLLLADDFQPKSAPDGHPLWDGHGALTKESAELARIAARAAEGAAKLRSAAELLELAGLLAPVRHPKLGFSTELRGVNSTMLAEFSPERAAALLRDDFLAMHLLFAMVFSARLFAPGILSASDDSHPLTNGPENSALDLASVALSHLNFAVDAGDLVPADFFSDLDDTGQERGRVPVVGAGGSTGDSM